MCCTDRKQLHATREIKTRLQQHVEQKQKPEKKAGSENQQQR
jgi:hypothetical protein